MTAIGTPVRRREDYRFLTGQGTYTDDINRPGQLHAFILRSPHANARLGRIDTGAAKSAPGVAAVEEGHAVKFVTLHYGPATTLRRVHLVVAVPRPLDR